MNIPSINYRQKSNFQNNTQPKPAFGRALTTAETQMLSQSLETAKEKSGINYLAMIMPIAATPAKSRENTGIGNFSGISKLFEKIAPLTGINASQLLPTGEISADKDFSPFNTPGFGLSLIYVNPFELTKDSYGNLLKESDPDLISFDIINHYKTNYENKSNIEKLLNKAYENYTKADNNSSIKQLADRFKAFKEKEEIKFWLDSYAKKYDSNNPERYKFKQFIAEEQYKKMQTDLKGVNKNGIKIIVDCPIGMNEALDGQIAKDKYNGENPFFSPKDSLACDNGGKAVRWSLPVLHPEKESAKSLVYHKALYQAKHGNGVRIDAAQYLMYPSINNGLDDKVIIPDVYNKNPKIIGDAFLSGIKDGGAEKDLCVAEHLPFNPAYDEKLVDSYLKDNGILNKIPKFSCAQWGDTDSEKWDCFANHDEQNIHQQKSPNTDEIKKTFAWLLGRPAKKYQLMFTDILGYSDAYNVKNTRDKNNWKFRLPENWETEYHDHLQKGLGFNAPETFDKVLEQKGVTDDKLKRKLYEFGQILRKKGVKTQQEADTFFGSDYIDSKLK